MNMKSNHWLRAVAISATAVWLTGCATHSQQVPAAKVTEQWQLPQAAQPAAQTAQPSFAQSKVAADLTRWWGQFDDPVLNDLILGAFEHSSTLGQAKATLENARAEAADANAALLPLLNLSGSATRDGDRKKGQSNPQNRIQLGVQASWEIDVFGGNRAASRAADAQVRGQEALRYDAQVAVAAEVANTYLNLRFCEARVQLAQAEALSRAQTAKLSDLSAKAGFLPDATSALATASAAQAASDLVAQQTECVGLVKVLVALTAMPEVQLVDRLKTNAAKLPVPREFEVPHVPAQLISQRPDVYDAGQQVLVTHAQMDQLRAAVLPKINLTGLILPTLVQNNGMNNRSTVWSFAAALTSPLFDGGRVKANLSAAQTRHAQSILGYQSTVRNAVREVETALGLLHSLKERAPQVQTTVVGFEKSLRAEEAKNKAGLGSQFELEDARRNALGSKTAALALERDRVATWIALYRAVGGGWIADAAPTTAAATSL